jgi:hypothetical protein
MGHFFRRSGWINPITGLRGTILLEVVVSSLILVVVILAIGSFFIGHLRAFDRGKEQMELQRMGTLAMEGMVRAIREGRWAVGITEGGSGTYKDILIFYPGEPFRDANRNGVYDDGEDFIDIYQVDSDGSPDGFEGVWNCASDETGNNPVPTAYFAVDETGPEGGIIVRGTNQGDDSPWDVLTSDTIRGSIWCDRLQFSIPSSSEEYAVAIALTMRNDMGTGEVGDDMSMDFSSLVNLRE